MQRFWNTFIKPVCDATKPRVLVEIGSRFGPNTKNFLLWCKDHDAHCIVVDPVTPGNMDEIGDLLDAHGTFHQGLSLDVLDKINGDIFFIDGDHNWYTVYHELLLIEQTAKTAALSMPIIFMHDVSWPYGLRDSYYDPDNIPAQYQQAYARKGMLVGQSDLAEQGGLNFNFPNALLEGGPMNGVWRGALDFIEQSSYPWRHYRIPGFSGLGILFVEDQLPENSVAAINALFDLPEHLCSHIENLENERLMQIVSHIDTRFNIKRD